MKNDCDMDMGKDMHSKKPAKKGKKKLKPKQKAKIELAAKEKYWKSTGLKMP